MTPSWPGPGEARPLFVGVVHLLPLPGAPRAQPGLDAVIDRAVADAEALQAGGADALIVENYGDTPFTAGAVAPVTLAAMTRVAVEIRRAAPRLALGVNVLRNDALGALAVACASGGRFIRVNVHTGAMITDQGVIEGRAHDTVRARRDWQADVAIAADLLVKHATPLGGADLAQVARDTLRRAHADVLLITGPETGAPTPPDRIRVVREAVPEALLWVASGVTPDQVPALDVDGLVVGTWLHEAGDIRRPLDRERIAALRDALER